MARVLALQLHVAHGEPMRAVAEADARVGGGLEGDSHVHRTKRAVTIVDRSTHDAVGVQPGDLRERDPRPVAGAERAYASGAW